MIFSSVSASFSQSNARINWMSWEQLDRALKEQPKPVFIYFHADWCEYCKKIKRNVFTKEPIIKRINKDYYAVEMDVEYKDTIVFDGVSFINAETKRNSIHQLPLLLASRKNKSFSLPATLIFDENFQIKARIFEYYTSKQLLNKL
ncbi:thioredoxin family protein [Seonamhaeicola marinus]|uniref:thioredoxin family protein n=1 Tax=Seonamhaeicola marinus TaxID=1912246 RepID=UPI001FEB41FD|nr:thioredoxin family protein [Seonamhaeicola marinus]